ncbi:putative O-methyltransferase [Quillaja saponaria]|uniref:O-methyltransferase n=1 Tax=Quillaja saponaria TaxID=32244 RepID=A0AAD7LVH1_QUISA|nr:putative O-methyltransferase [Quillaja saponaria]
MMEKTQEQVLATGQTEFERLLFGFADTVALKCALELHIADIIHSHGNGGSITLSQLASAIDTPFPNISNLARIMRFLVHKKIFTNCQSSDGGEPLYGLTDTSRWFLSENNTSFLNFHTHPLILNSWYSLSRCVIDGGSAFKSTNKSELWDVIKQNPQLNDIVNESMASTAKFNVGVILSEYKDGFVNIESLVDVGGGTGTFVTQVVKSYPHIKGINFDLPHVVATAQDHKGVITHVGGDMFQLIPKVDAVSLMYVLHDWSDEECIKILKNCRKAIPEQNGKVIIVDIVLEQQGQEAS